MVEDIKDTIDTKDTKKTKNKDRERNYFFTLNLPKEEDKNIMSFLSEKDIIEFYYNLLLKAFDNDKFKLVVFQLELGEEEHRLHFQGYVEKYHASTFDAMKHYFNKLGLSILHFESRWSTRQKVIDYCVKSVTKFISEDYPEGLRFLKNYELYNELEDPREAKVNPLAVIRDRILNGEVIEDLIFEYPEIIAKNIKYCELVRAMYFEKKFKYEKRVMDNVLIYSEFNYDPLNYIYDKYGYKNIYRCSFYNKNAFDNYDGESVLLLDNYYNDFPKNYLMKLLNGYPLYLPCRFKDKLACFYKVIIVINTNIHNFMRDYSFDIDDLRNLFTEGIFEANKKGSLRRKYE